MKIPRGVRRAHTLFRCYHVTIFLSGGANSRAFPIASSALRLWEIYILRGRQRLIHTMPRARKQVTRSFSACWTCRRRRVKCNGVGLPCNQCKKCRLECEGYSIQLVWVDPKTGTYPPFFRRSMNFEQTWRGWPAFGEDHLQRLIDEMDSIDIPIAEHSPSLNPFTAFHSSQPINHSTLDNPTANKSALNLHNIASLTDLSQSEKPPSPCIEASYSLLRPLTPTIYDWLSTSRDEATIFHHYVTWIAPIMIPVDSTNNPWKSVYPSTALQDSSAASRALYHAIIAQSAFNMANLYKESPEMYYQKESVALEHYGASLRELSQTLNYTKEAEYNACAATLYTLMISEVSICKYSSQMCRFICFLLTKSGSGKRFGRLEESLQWSWKFCDSVCSAKALDPVHALLGNIPKHCPFIRNFTNRKRQTS